MSRQSKAKRDARRKKEGARPIRRLGQSLQPHAQLVDADGNVIGGAGYRVGQWLRVLGGQVVARTPSAAMTLAVLRHVVALQVPGEGAVTLTQSPTMTQAATREAAAAGMSLEDYLQLLEQERQERNASGEMGEDSASSADAHADTGASTGTEGVNATDFGAPDENVPDKNVSDKNVPDKNVPDGSAPTT